MNDFLQSLRSSTARNQRTGITRKSQDHEYHSANQHYQYYNGYYNNNAAQPAQPYPAQPYPATQTAVQSDDHNISSLLLATIESLSRQVETLVTSQNQLIAAQEKTASVIGRQTRAIEKIVAHIDTLPDNWIEKSQEFS